MSGLLHTHSANKTGRRGDARLRTRVPGELQLVDRNCRCLLDNISNRGARVTLENPPPAGVRAIFLCGGIDVFGHVVWSQRGQCGLLFADQLSDSQVVQMRDYSDGFASEERIRLANRTRDWVQGKINMV
jgi:PilZ domain